MPILGSQGSGAKGAPTVPVVGTATVTNSTTVSLTFTAPDSKLPITSYTVTSSPSISLSTSGTTSPVTVTGTFADGQAYTFTIAANNLNGTSSASSASNSITPVIPKAGFMAGGLASNGSTRLNTISKVTFSNDSTTTLGAGLSQARYTHSAHSNSGTAGYVCGGYTNSHTSIIDKVTYSSGSVSTLSPGLAATSYEGAGFANSGSHGYVVGGQNQSFNQWGNYIQRTSYSDDTTSGINMSSGSFSQEFSGASNNGVAGYTFGNFVNPSASNTIMKFLFSSNTASSIANTLTNSVGRSTASANSGVAAYVGGGGNPYTSNFSNIDKLTFSNDTKSGLGATLSQTRYRGNGYANSGTASYFSQGDSTGGWSTVDKLTFSNETRSTLSSNITVQNHAAGFANSGVL